MNQTQCPHPANYRYTWPGRNEAYICTIHAEGLKRVANAMGLHLQLIPIQESEKSHTCEQKISTY